MTGQYIPKEAATLARYDELMAAVCQDENDKTTYGPLVQKAVLLEQRLEYLETLPYIKINPKDPTQQKMLPAFKQYKELLQQYNNSLKLLFRISGDDAEAEGESPLRAWLKSRKEGAADDMDT